MALMIQHAVPPTPSNYEIWYGFVAEQSPQLTRAVESWIATGGPFNDGVADGIRRTAFPQGLTPQAFNEIGDRIGAELERITQSLEIAGRDTSAYGNTLRGAAGVLGKEASPPSIKTVIDNLVMATRHMEKRSRELETRLQESTNEVRLLREDMDGIRRQALTDQLTGIANRKCFDETLREAVIEARQTREPLTLLMGDIDHFKKFNDTWGHQTGDQVLRLVARCLTENIKGRDTAARYGGEEFAVILPNTALENATTVAHQIRQAVQAKKVVKRSTGETLGTITMSLGAALFNIDESSSDLIERADAALYAAKRGGRNCVRTERDPDVAEVLAHTTAEASRKTA